MTAPTGPLATLGSAMGKVIAIEQKLSTALNAVAAVLPSFPAVRITDMDIGLPHAHAHPPNLIPPAPPVPLPSTGPVIPIPILSGASKTLINNLPAARCGDMGLGIWCGGYFPMYEIFLGSSNVWIEGSRAARVGVDITKHCIFTSPRPQDPPIGPMVGATVTSSANVLIGGVPMPSLFAFAFGKALKAFGKAVVAGARAVSKVGQKIVKNMRPGFIKCTILRAEPVNSVTGEVVVDQQDFVLPGRIPLEWNRHYSSQSNRAGVCGHGWETPADSRLEFEPDGSVVFFDGGSGASVFLSAPTTEPVLALVDGAVLSKTYDRFTVQTKAGLSYRFRRLLDSSNESLVESITDRSGNSWQFLRRGSNLYEIQESSERSIEVQSRDGRIEQLALKHSDSKDPHVLVRYEYDEAGNLTTVYDALNSPYRLSYENHCLVRHMDRNGLSFYYKYDRCDHTGRCIHAWGDGGLYNYHFDYVQSVDKYLNFLGETRITNSLGNVASLRYDDRDLVLEETDPLGGITTYEYDQVGRTSAVIDAAGNRTEYLFDERGNLVKLIRPDGTSLTTQYNADSMATAITDFNGNCWCFEWDNRAFLRKRVSPRGATWTYRYSAEGDLVRICDPLDAITTLRRDRIGNITSVINPLGQATKFEWNLLGSVTATIDPTGAVTRFLYDSQSQLKGTIYPTGRKVVAEYDPNGNLETFIDESGNRTKIEYTGLGEVARRINSDGTQIRYRYDTEENLLAIINERGEEYKFVRDALGRVTTETDYWGNRREQTWDAAGRLAEVIDPLGRKTAYSFDAVGRLRAKEYSLGEKELFDYDPNGNLIAAENGKMKVFRMFDEDNRVIEESQGDFKINNSYDLNGNRVSRTSSNGHVVRFAYDANNLVTRIAVGNGPPIELQRDARGFAVAESIGTDIRQSFGYDLDGRLLEQVIRKSAGSWSQQKYAYDSGGSLLERIDSQKGRDTYTYDSIGRIIEHEDAAGRVQRFSRDAAGDLLKELQHGGQPGERVLRYGDAQYRFDACGNLVERSGNATLNTFRWDGCNRLIAATRPDQTLTEMAYDALGRRVAKSTGEECTTFFWDGDQLLADHSETTGTREFVFHPGTFTPVACIEPDGQVVYFRTDNIGLPWEVVDAAGETVWSATFTEFGKVNELRANEFENPIRLQGQYYDWETGLSYTRHRHFDPSLGAFISQDPLRMTAGENLYEYAPNIWSWRDPYGLACEKLGLGLWGDQVIAFRQWADKHGLKHLTGGGFPTTGPGGFADHMDYLTGRVKEVHVRLDGLLEDGVLKVPDNAHVLDKFGNPVNGFTNYEMYLIKSGKVPADKVKWHLGDHVFGPGYSPFE